MPSENALPLANVCGVMIIAQWHDCVRFTGIVTPFCECASLDCSFSGLFVLAATKQER